MNRDGGGLLLYDLFTNTGQLAVEVFQGKHPCIRVTPMEDPMCTYFKEYEEVLEMVPLELSED